jgi:hypothetical protein
MITTSAHPAPPGYRSGIGARVAGPRMSARVARWLAADPREALRFTPRAPREGIAGAREEPGALHAMLASWRRPIARSRALVIARRYLLLAAVLVCIGALAARLVTGTVPWWAIALPAAVAACGALMALSRPLPLEAVARLLDRDLSLHEQAASALEVADGRARGTNGALNAYLEERAVSALAGARREWRVRLAPAPGEWLGIVVLAAAVAVLLVVPRSSPTAGLGVRPHPPAVARVPAPSRVALTVPAVPAEGRLPVHVSAAVVSSPAARPAATPGAAGGHRQSQSQHLVSSRPRSAARPPAGAHTSAATGTKAKSSGQTGGRLPGAPDSTGVQQPQQGGAARAGAQGSSISVYKGNQRRVVASSKGAPAGHAGAAAGAPGAQAPGGASARSGQSTRSGGNAPGAQQTSYTCLLNPQSCANRPGANPPGAQALPYGGGFHLTPSQLPKPGLIVGKGSFQGKGTPGGSGVGHEPGSASGQSAAHSSLQTSKGRQFNLQSGYGGAQGTRTGKPAPGHSAATGGQSTAAPGTGQAGLQVIDYVPPDSNAVAPTDRSIVTSYFVSRAAQQ